MKNFILNRENWRTSKKSANTSSISKIPVTRAKLEHSIRRIVKEKEAEAIVKKTIKNMKALTTKREKKESFLDKMWRWFR